MGLVVAAKLSAPSRQPEEQNPSDVGLGYREVSLRSADGLRLAARAGARGQHLQCGGPGPPASRGDKSDRHVLETAAIYAQAGYGVLMIDLRAQGRSDGERVTMGYEEVQDMRGALSWLEERGFSPAEVLLHGFSLGGATVLRAAPTAGVAAVVEESAYADLPLILRQQLPQAQRPAVLLRPSPPVSSSWGSFFWA